MGQVRRLQQASGRPSGFEREYAELCASIDRSPSFKAGLTPQTKQTRAKNRYCDVIPLDKTRVRLVPQHGDQFAAQYDDYINANHVDGGYIACCAPVPAAIADFWHMVWQQRVHVVLMLTNFVERERCKAHVYWDVRGQPVDFVGVHVQLVEQEGDGDQQLEEEGFLTRMFRVWTVDERGREIESRIVKHLQLTIWPDHGVLQDFRVIAPLLHSVNAFKDEASLASGADTRVIVHCSAGIGRSGTFIAIDILLKQLQRAINGQEQWTEALDVARVVHRIRSQRPGMVQTPVSWLVVLQYLPLDVALLISVALLLADRSNTR